MPSDKEILVRYLAELNSPKVLEITRSLLASGTPSGEIFLLLRRGMDQVNNSCVAGEYFIADLIMANNIYREAVSIAISQNSGFRDETLGTVLMGTVQGDIHGLGKDLISKILMCSGFETFDLGVDVSPERFVSAILTHTPNLLVLSGTISGSEIMMARTIEAIEAAGVRGCIRIILGGNCIDEKQSLLIGADAYSRDLFDCLRLCKQLALGED